jgi:hypothetical protein
MMTWTLAPALVQLRLEVNRAAPNRSKKSDGTIGDTDHQQRPTSDHNPNGAGVVCAIDFTHDPKHFNAHKFADQLRERCAADQEKRVNYIISKGRIASERRGWEWREYTGLNAHKSHVHISVKQEPRRYNNAGSWWLKHWF